MPDRPPRCPDAAWILGAVEAHEGALVRYAGRLLGDLDLARDVVQDTFLKLWEGDRAELDGRLAPWLYTVCRNRALDVIRKDRRMTALADNQVDGRPAPAAGRAESAEGLGQVLGALAELPERQQEVIRLKFQGGLSYREIGQVMDLTVSHVGVLIHNGLKTVREKLAATARLNPSVSR